MTTKSGYWNHYLKYEGLVNKIGHAFIRSQIPFDYDTLKAAYEKDGHFNSLPMDQWEMPGLMKSFKGKRTITVMTRAQAQGFGIEVPEWMDKVTVTMTAEPQDNDVRLVVAKKAGVPISTADIVCITKHYARHHILKIKPRQEIAALGLE